LAQVVSEPIFDILRLVEAARHQRFDPFLGGGSCERSDARIPPDTELDVRRQAGVDEALGGRIRSSSSLIPELLTFLDAFLQERRRYGDLEAGVEPALVWMACDCGADACAGTQGTQ
jgi:hypothetical protein